MKTASFSYTRFRWGRTIAVTQIALQVGMALLPAWSGLAQAASQPNLYEDDFTRTQALAGAKQSGALDGYLSQQASAAATQELQAWLQQFGSARVELGTDRHLKPQNGAVDLLLPLHKDEQRLLFTQNGVRSKEGQVTVNLGLGQRHFTDSWMFGYNAFYDHNVSEGHQRLGLGAEAWRDYFKLSTNGYFRLSNWQASKLVEDYDARPANGFDLRLEGWLPAMPQVGGRLMYEKYYGDEVALFGKDRRQSNPSAVTAGLNWTPVPLLSLNADHKAGGSQSETLLGLQLNWKLGESLRNQLDGSRVGASRTLAGSGMDLVERNNNIVLEYRKQELIQLGLPSQINGAGGEVVALDYRVKAKYGLARIVWNDAALKAAGGQVKTLTDGQYQVVMPKYNAGAANRYLLSGVAYDKRNNVSAEAQTVVTVSQPAVNADRSEVAATPAVVIADGRATSIIRIALRDADGEAVTGMAAALSAELAESVAVAGSAKALRAAEVPAKAASLHPEAVEQEPGVYLMTLTAGTRPGSVRASPVVNGTPLSAVMISQVSDAASAVVADGDVTLLSNHAAANGSALNRVQAKVTDATGNPVAGVAVTFSINGSAQPQSPLTALSDGKGLVTLSLSDRVAEAVTVTATTANGGSAQVQAIFIADAGSAAIDKNDLTVNRVSVVANGSDAAIFTAQVKDANNNPVPGMAVSWSSDGGALSASSSNTDAAGYAQVTLTSTKAGNIQLQAAVNGGAAVDAPVVNFTGDSGSAGIAGSDLTADKTSAVANGSEQVTYSAIVKDAHGNPLENQTVNWTTTLGVLNGTSSSTDGAGKAVITLTSTRAGIAQVTAAVGTSAATSAPQVTFQADSSSAVIDRNDLTVNRNEVLANGSDAALYSAVVKDAHGNLVAGATVSWATDRGNLSDSSSVTNASGVATTHLTGVVAGDAQTTASVNGQGAVNAPLVTLKADESTAVIAAGDLTADKSSAVASGSDAVTYTAIVKDANGNPIPNLVVSWVSDNGTLTAGSTTTNSAGQARVSLTSIQAGNAVVSATPGSGTAVNATAVRFIGDAGSAVIGAGDVTVDVTTLVANGSDSATYTARVKDANNNPVPAATVTWRTTLGDLRSSSSVTNDAGEATMTLTGTKAGAATVSAQINSASQSAPVVTLNADASTARIASNDVTADKTRIQADGTDSVTYSARVTDANGNTLSGITVNWVTTDGNLTGSSSVSRPDGVANISLSKVLTGASTPDGNAVVSAAAGSTVKEDAPAVTLVVPPQTYTGPTITFKNSDPPKSANITVSGRSGNVTGDFQVRVKTNYITPDRLSIILKGPGNKTFTLKTDGSDGSDLANKLYTVAGAGVAKSGTWTLQMDALAGANDNNYTMEWEVIL